jgi:hypothetical protein
MPVIRWPLTTPFPLFLRYKETVRYHQDVELRSDSTIVSRMDDFLERCRDRSRIDTGSVGSPTWQLRGAETLRYAAGKGDAWAKGAMLFLRRISQNQLPF